MQKLMSARTIELGRRVKQIQKWIPLMSSRFVLREFAYFDRQKVVDFVSALEDGLVRSKRETSIIGDRELRGEIGLSGVAKLELSKGTTRKEVEQEKAQTDASLFERLHSMLLEQGLLKDLNAPELGERDLMEAEVNVALSAKDRFFEIVDIVKELGQLAGQSAHRGQPSLFQVLRVLSEYASRQGITLVMTPRYQSNTKLFSALPTNGNKLRTAKSELNGTYRILCRILRILKVGEKVNLFGIVPGISLQQETIQQFINAQPDVLTGKISMNDLEVAYPAIEVTTIALYR
jgi:hypothetical protein